MEKFTKNAFLYLSKNKAATKTAKKYGLRFGAKRFVAGAQIEEAVGAVKRLNSLGIMATLDHLGEFVSNEEEAEASARACINALEAIHKNGLQANLSLKLTQLGLDISDSACLANMTAILDKAKERDIFVRIDMEDYKRNERTIELFKALRAKYEKVGLVIQAYLYKSEADIEKLNEIGANLRVCKGAYKEPAEVAYPEKSDVDRNYLKLVRARLLSGNHTAIATHDENMIDAIKTFIGQENVPNDRFEFQMLYGIRTDLQEQLAKEGYKVRAYVPYGDDWYGYFMRRLAERPANVWFVVKNLFN